MDIINCYKEKYNIDIKNHRDCAWPKLLATKLNLKLEDRSESGAGADRIWRQAWEYCNGNLEKAKETIFILEVPSFLNRSDVRFKDDKWVICNTEWNDDGEIEQLICENGTYVSDFFIDCTGFKRILINKLGAKWQSYSKYLKMKSAIVFPIGDTEEYNIWTTAQAMDYGWMFKIPVWGRSGNGYIFDSDYITPEQAKLEVEKFIGHEIDIGKHITFDPGALDKVWIKNCCAVGLSASFVEPLEATSIGTSIQQTFLLMHRLPNYDNNTIDKYNKDVSDILINIRDFVLLHYITKKQNTIFWHDVSKLELPDTLKNNLERWNKNLPIFDDFSDITGYRLFNSLNYLQIMAPLGLFDIEKIKEEYNMMNTHIKNKSREILNNIKSEELSTYTIGHKEFITRIRQKVGK